MNHPELVHGLELLPCAIRDGMLYIPHADGNWVSAAKLQPFSLAIIECWRTEQALTAPTIPQPAATAGKIPTMDDALAAGDGTLHGAIDYWQNRALAAEAARDVDETNKVLADNYLRATAGKAEGESKPFGWYGEYRFENDFTTNEDTSRHWHANGYRLTPLYAAPSHPPIAAPAGADTRRLDWLDAQRVAYGFADVHEGNGWEISGAYGSIRQAIDHESGTTGEASHG